MGAYAGPDIVESGLVLSLDAGNSKSYPGSETTWTDLINSNTAFLDTPTYSNGTLNFSGIYDIVSSNYNLTLGSSFSISLWLKHTNSSPIKETYISLGFDKIVVRVNDVGNLNLYVTDATEQNLWVWGTNNTLQLGLNQNNFAVPDRNTPVTTFSGGTNWKQVSCGEQHTVAIKTDGTLWTWGQNNVGQLGDNTTTDRSIPVTTFAGGTDWKSVSAGGCTAAIKTDGSLWTWGSGADGRLGDFATTNKSTPVTTFAGGNNWKQVSSGTRYTFAVKTDGSLWGWGYNQFGMLGTNDTNTRSTPVTTFAGGNNWKQVASGGFHTAAIKTDGSLWTWGSSAFLNYGQLGVNDNTDRNTPVTTFAGGTNWKQVSCGVRNTTAIKTDGSLWTWGEGGRTGDNTTIARSTPVTTFAGGNNWKSVSSSLSNVGHISAIKTDGTLWVWGRNNERQLGTNDTTSRSIPVTTFAGGTDWKSVSAGGVHTAAIRTNETTTTDVSISTPILNTTYYNIVATSNGTTLKLYQNNSLLTTANLNGTLTSTTLFYTISDIMNSFAGNLSNIQVYNKELSTAEISQNYISIKSRFGL